jgi:hypothetical protein
MSADRITLRIQQIPLHDRSRDVEIAPAIPRVLQPALIGDEEEIQV